MVDTIGSVLGKELSYHELSPRPRQRFVGIGFPVEFDGGSAATPLAETDETLTMAGKPRSTPMTPFDYRCPRSAQRS